jgi:hypothetical protein
VALYLMQAVQKGAADPTMVKALRVQLYASLTGHAEPPPLSPAADKATLLESPAHNDINFWRPNPLWFQVADG